jgi:hypothetical protein
MVTGVPGQLDPARISHAAQYGPVVDRQVEQGGRQCGDQSAVGHQDDRAVRPAARLVGTPFIEVGNELVDHRQAACRDVDPALAAMRCPPGIVTPRQPRTRCGGVDLKMRHPLPVTEMSLAQTGVHAHRDGGALAERVRGVEGAAQIR